MPILVQTGDRISNSKNKPTLLSQLKQCVQCETGASCHVGRLIASRKHRPGETTESESHRLNASGHQCPALNKSANASQPASSVVNTVRNSSQCSQHAGCLTQPYCKYRSSSFQKFLSHKIPSDCYFRDSNHNLNGVATAAHMDICKEKQEIYCRSVKMMFSQIQSDSVADG